MAMNHMSDLEAGKVNLVNSLQFVVELIACEVVLGADMREYAIF